MSVSLRRRAIAGGVLWAVVAMLIGGVLLVRFIDTFTVRQFDAALGARLLQLVAAFDRSPDDPEAMEPFLSDPAYGLPYSGRYWQVTAADGTVFTSRSLFDTVLAPPPLGDRSAAVWEGDGPSERVRGASRQIALENGSTWLLTTAESLTALDAERALIRQRMFLAFAVIGALAVVAAAVQTTLMLRPLGRLREDIATRWDRGERLLDADYPEEVVPLVRELNAALDRNSVVIDRARRQAADLAHVLNTPSAILHNELGAYRAAGVDTDRAQDALARIDAQITRSLARIRSSAVRAEGHARTDLAASVHRILRVIGSARDPAPAFVTALDAGLHVIMDRQDLEEALGNVLDNAAKWCERRVSVSATLIAATTVVVAIEDDGPGITENHLTEVLVEGRRLDLSKPGTGLGLAIVSDLMAAYGGSIVLMRSAQFGGLRAELHLPGRQLADAAIPA